MNAHLRLLGDYRRSRSWFWKPLYTSISDLLSYPERIIYLLHMSLVAASMVHLCSAYMLSCEIMQVSSFFLWHLTTLVPKLILVIHQHIVFDIHNNMTSPIVAYISVLPSNIPFRKPDWISYTKRFLNFVKRESG